MTMPNSPKCLKKNTGIVQEVYKLSLPPSISYLDTWFSSQLIGGVFFFFSCEPVIIEQIVVITKTFSEVHEDSSENNSFAR